MLALEIDDELFLPDDIEDLDSSILDGVQKSSCCHCGKSYGEGRMIMYIQWKDSGRVQWWHYVDMEVINRESCGL